MLRVPTFLAPSPIQGLGLFTSEPLPEGTTIWSFDASVDLRLEPELFDALPEPVRSRLREWTYEEPDGKLVLCGDNAKFMNHSFTPNCVDLEWTSTVTLRDIAAGEELTCDYRLIDMESARSGLAHWVPDAPVDASRPDGFAATTVIGPAAREELERLWREDLDGPPVP